MASTIYNVHLYPSVYLKNFLPIDVIICLPGIARESLLEAGASLQLPTVDPIKSNIIIKVKYTSIDLTNFTIILNCF